ncbi:membrane protein YfhO [Maribacter sedimenticola]|uniref:Membrane protein YfhO n=1 Tax=Maribacter sedimenticola TaxID=228956 RepID=A0ABY1SK41_9FLAO|nr:YfhO family protein [Maribacter sedimenticola]SNR65317.1 membrane protein YfhO [Maribacter sedimenticola]
MKQGLKFFFIHFFVIAFFIVAALSYFNPVLQGKVMYQHDIAQYTGMAKEQNDFRKANDQEPYWTNSAFGGMPTYQLGANYPHNYIKQLDRVIRFLPRPADYLFLYMLGFYILLCCLKVDYRLAVVGALAFGFSTYLIIILGAGHNAKAHAIAYLPVLLAGIVLVFRKKYLWGFVLTALAMALEITANHYQMTYYFMLLVLIMGVVYLVYAIKEKEIKHFGISVGILAIAVTLGIAANATGLMATKEYADWSTRGKSELTINPDGSPKQNIGGLSKSYITNWSYGITESLNLFVPRLFGGASQENLGEESKSFNYLIDKGLPRSSALEFVSGLPLYWGEQPGTSGPAYLGAVVFFLFFLGLFLVKGKHKWWLLFGSLMSLILSWGKNFSVVTDFMIDYFPLYDKFRAVSSIQIILELCVPILAILALKKVAKDKVPTMDKFKSLKLATGVIVGIGAILFLFKGSFDFVGAADDNLRMTGLEELPEMLRLDRKAVYTNDLLRSLGFALVTALLIWFYLKQKIRLNYLVIAIGLMIVIDLVNVDLRYVNNDNFVSKRKMLEPFQASAANKIIAKDEGVYRVFDQTDGFDSAKTAYFHQTITGYHAAKPAGMQDLFNFHIYNGNLSVMNMLNVKYLIRQDQEGKTFPIENPNANGNAWFVQQLVPVPNANEEIKALDSLDTKNNAVFNESQFEKIAPLTYPMDSTATISLTAYEPNHLVYRSNNNNEGVAVFSEMYYKNGWNAYIDGEVVDHFKVNYVLRALSIPAGAHKIEFKFEPQVVAQGSKITLASNILLVLIILGGIGFTFWNTKKEGEA